MNVSRRRLVMVCCLIGTASVDLSRSARAEVTMLAAAQGSRLFGAGVAGDTFDVGPGLVLEFGIRGKWWGWIIYGFEYVWTKNRVGANVTDAMFIQPIYTDFRIFLLPSSDIQPFITAGVGFSRMHLEGADGWENQWNISLGAGVIYRLKSVGFFQLTAKPSFLIGNTLGQSWGLELHLGAGVRMGSG